ncbi:unnamed protein product [Durusdinium trenchii]|uniref:Uncharacterized protein n=1 Tax=Durusdinium trenchii TaxID=1381693 RepID=A0ABP0IHK7_9DINO
MKCTFQAHDAFQAAARPLYSVCRTRSTELHVAEMPELSFAELSGGGGLSGIQ